MKKVLFRERNWIHVSDLNDSHIIGVELESGRRCFICKIQDGEYIFGDISAKNTEYDSHVKFENIRGVFNDSDYIKSVFVFDTIYERAMWLVENLKP